MALLFVRVIGRAAASAAGSQQPTASGQSKTPAKTADSVVFKPSPELQKSLDELSAAVQALPKQITSHPEIKTAAMNVASGFVTTAAQVIADQSFAIEDALN